MSFDPVPIAVFVVSCVTLLVGWAVYWDFRKKQLMFEERRVAIENGMTPPPLPTKQLGGWPGVRQREVELKFEERKLMIERGLPLQEEQKKPLTRNDYLRRGVVAIGIGAGALVAYVLLGTSPNVGGLEEARAWCAGVGPVILLYGVACLVYRQLMTESPPATTTDKVEVDA